jgi:hypothetical protein
MADKLKHDLRRRLEALSKDDPNTHLTFIVTLRAGANSASVAKEGMQIEQRIDEPPLLIGTMTPAQALAVARLDNVALVEQDERGVHAIDASR